MNAAETIGKLLEFARIGFLTGLAVSVALLGGVVAASFVAMSVYGLTIIVRWWFR